MTVEVIELFATFLLHAWDGMYREILPQKVDGSCSVRGVEGGLEAADTECCDRGAVPVCHNSLREEG